MTLVPNDISYFHISRWSYSVLLTVCMVSSCSKTGFILTSGYSRSHLDYRFKQFYAVLRFGPVFIFLIRTIFNCIKTFTISYVVVFSCVTVAVSIFHLLYDLIIKKSFLIVLSFFVRNAGLFLILERVLCFASNHIWIFTLLHECR